MIEALEGDNPKLPLRRDRAFGGDEPTHYLGVHHEENGAIRIGVEGVFDLGRNLGVGA